MSNKIYLLIWWNSSLLLIQRNFSLLHIIFVKLLKLIYQMIQMYLSTVTLSKYEIPSGYPRVTAGTIFVDILFVLTYTVFVNSTNDLQYLQILRRQCCLLCLQRGCWNPQLAPEEPVTLYGTDTAVHPVTWAPFLTFEAYLQNLHFKAYKLIMAAHGICRILSLNIK